MTDVDSLPQSRELGRYLLCEKIAAGGMATVHFGRLRGAVGFSKVVAIKRLHPNYARDAEFRQMFLNEARLAACLKHPNVVSTLDVVADEEEVFLVMEFVLGESLEALMPRRTGCMVSLAVATAVICNVLEGLHSAHEAKSETGERLEIVHRDVSPQNILVGEDGVGRVFDFGIAKAASNTQETREGVIKGKVTYMAPEQVRGTVDRRADLYAVGVILWELLVGRRRHEGERNDSLYLKLAKNELPPLPPPSTLRADVPQAIDRIIARATQPAAVDRFSTASEMALALEAAVRPALPREVGAWVKKVAGERLKRLTAITQQITVDGAASQPNLSIASSSIVTLDRPVPAPEETASSLSPAEPTLDAPRPTRFSPRRTSFLVFVAAMLVIFGSQTLRKRGGILAPPEVPASGEMPVPAPTGEAPKVAPAMTPSAPPSEAPEPRVAVDAGIAPPHRVSSPSPSPVRVTQPPAPRVVPRQPEPPPPPSASASAIHKPKCENPFVIGSDGIRQVKPECL